MHRHLLWLPGEVPRQGPSPFAREPRCLTPDAAVAPQAPGTELRCRELRPHGRPSTGDIWLRRAGLAGLTCGHPPPGPEGPVSLGKACCRQLLPSVGGPGSQDMKAYFRSCLCNWEYVFGISG